MRPVNLIPPEDRRGSQGKLRTGPIAYILIGALVLVLGGVTALGLTGNQIAESKSEVAQLKSEDATAKAEARRLVAYTQFQALHEQRLATITSLADSRFDWERVMRELALVLPHNVWLISLGASVSPESGAGAASTSSGSSSGGGGGLRSTIPGPALELAGCAAGQEAVAGFVTALKEIDGVTRVGVESSELPNQEEGAGSSSGSSSEGSGSSGDCRTRRFIAQFKITVAFDAAPVVATGAEAAEAPAPPAAEEGSSQTTSETSSETSEGG